MPERLISIAEARARVLAAAVALDAEPVTVERALGRVLAEDVRAAGDVPPFANSAMDGFAIAAGAAGRTLRIAGESRAGAPARSHVAAGEAFRISTGAVLPAGADAVARVEDTEERDGHVAVRVAAATGANVRAAGEDLRAGQVVLRRGARLGPGELGVLVGAGRAEAACARRPRLALVATGDELVAPGVPLGPGQIHESNLVTMAALATAAGAVVVGAARAADRPDATRAALERALTDADVVAVTGGVSVGVHDHVKDALRDLGVEERFWGVALRPGKPTWFGTRGDALVFGLPGNPVSAMVTFALFARPALGALQGATVDDAPGSAALGEAVARNSRREQAIRVRLALTPSGVVATPTGAQGSHVLSSMLGADALAIIPVGEAPLPAGAEVRLERLL